VNFHEHCCENFKSCCFLKSIFDILGLINVYLWCVLFSYCIWDNALGAAVTSYPAASDGPGYIDCLRAAFQDIFEILKSSHT
jgi:hypothetical protein